MAEDLTIFAKVLEFIRTDRSVSTRQSIVGVPSLPKTVFQLSVEPPTPKFAHAAKT